MVEWDQGQFYLEKSAIELQLHHYQACSSAQSLLRFEIELADLEKFGKLLIP